MGHLCITDHTDTIIIFGSEKGKVNLIIFFSPLLLKTQVRAHPYSKVIPLEQLYPNLSDSDPDYGCRYGSYTSQDCYCCGVIKTYVEHGDICTKFCFVKSEQKPRYGQISIIRLPENFGGHPIKMRLDNGLEIPVTEEKSIAIIETGVEGRM